MSQSVSIIIPVFNSLQWLPSTLQSCWDQGDHLLEIIVVDDHSTDGSWEFLEDLASNNAQLRIFRNPRKGANSARNYGFEQSKGAYIQWLDADDMLLPGKFKTQIKAFEKDESLDLIYSDIEIRTYDDNGNYHSNIREGSSEQDYLGALLLDKWLSPNAYLLRRSAAETGHKLMAWNLSTPVHQDTEYFTRLAIHGLKFSHLPGVYATYSKWSLESISRLHYRKKAFHRFGLMERFRIEIYQSNHFSDQQKRKYATIINTTLLQLTIYAPKVSWRESFSYYTVQPSLVQTRARYALFFAYLWLWAKGLFR